MARNIGERELRYVSLDLAGITGIKYCFRSGLKESLKDNFGQTNVTSQVNVDKLIFEANNIKPAKASVFTQGTGYEGSFCSTNKVKTLKADGAQVTRAKYRPQALSGRANSNLYYVTINGLKFGYRVVAAAGSMPTDFASVTGMTLATGNDVVIMGASFPRLGQLKYLDSATGVVLSFLCDPAKYDNALPDGWSKGKPPLKTQADFLSLVGV